MHGRGQNAKYQQSGKADQCNAKPEQREFIEATGDKAPAQPVHHGSAELPQQTECKKGQGLPQHIPTALGQGLSQHGPEQEAAEQQPGLLRAPETGGQGGQEIIGHDRDYSIRLKSALTSGHCRRLISSRSWTPSSTICQQGWPSLSASGACSTPRTAPRAARQLR